MHGAGRGEKGNLRIQSLFVLHASVSALIRPSAHFPCDMNTISGKIIDRTWKRVNEATPEDVQQITAKLFENQPFIGAYLMAVEESMESASERGNLLFIAVIIFESMSAGREPLRTVSSEEIDAAESANVKFLEKLEDGSEMDHMDAFQGLLTNYNQGPLLAAVVEALMSDDQEEPDSAPESVGMSLLHLKTVIDCWDQC